MRIAVLGGGAMGMLFASMLASCHDVVVMDRNAAKVEAIKSRGITLEEQDGTLVMAHPGAAQMGEPVNPADLVLVFVKAMGTREALEKCRALIGEHTLLLTLQNGGGHEDVLSQFVLMQRVLLGTTQHNASVREDGRVFHGGSGQTVIGSPVGEHEQAEKVAIAFEAAGIRTVASRNVRETIWRKLMTNASLSALTGVFQMPMGFVADSVSAWRLCEMLVREACAVAAADGVVFDPQEKIEEVRQVAVKGPRGITSICADLMHGRMTEVDTISGSVVRAAARLHVPAPHHEMMVLLIHAMEDKNRETGK